MKNYKDMADAVFARRDEYVASVTKKKKLALSASLSLCAICLAVMGAFGIWKSGVLEPDPNVIGTKPHSFTEPTAGTQHSLSNNATSEGRFNETTEIVSGNSKPQNTTDINKNPTEDSKPKSTDPAENPGFPAVRPNIPVVKPTIPVLRPTLPTLPIVTEPVEEPTWELNGYPDVPPTSGNPVKPKPVVTDPVENEPGNDSVGENDTVMPTVPDPPNADKPATSEPDNAYPDEPVYTEPCCTQPPLEEPTDAPCGPEAPEVEAPPTEALSNIVEGKVLDQYGNPVKGAVVKVYNGGKLSGSYTTSGNGYYYIADFKASATITISSVPAGYSTTGFSSVLGNGYNYIILTCNKN